MGPGRTGQDDPEWDSLAPDLPYAMPTHRQYTTVRGGADQPQMSIGWEGFGEQDLIAPGSASPLARPCQTLREDAPTHKRPDTTGHLRA